MIKPKIFLICTGLGHINRGYESFTRECFDALKNNDFFHLYLFKGAGEETDSEIQIANLPRRKSISKKIAKFLNLDPYTIEQITFCISLLPHLITKKPSVIYYSDFELGTYLWHLRKYLGFKYKLLFANGAPNGPPFKTEDHVQQLLLVYLEQAISQGESADKQTLLPYGFSINLKQRFEALAEKNEVRNLLGFNINQKIILSVGAINMHHKRMNYIIEELSLLDDQFFLVILGQYEQETEIIVELANQKLPGRFLIKNVPYDEVEQYYVAADLFVLASLNEGFGRVLIEAASYGLPCIVHDYINAHEVLGKLGIYINMEKNRSLSSILSQYQKIDSNDQIIQEVYERYSWEKLSNQYHNMIVSLITY